MKIDTATTAQWVHQWAQSKLQEAAGQIQENIQSTRAYNRQKADEVKALGDQIAARPAGKIDTYA